MLHKTSCDHDFHRECISRWFESSDDCPVCRCTQVNDPLITFKHNIRTTMEETYMEAIRSLENEIDILRRRRRRASRID